MNKSILYLLVVVIPLSAGRSANMTNQDYVSRYTIVFN